MSDPCGEAFEAWYSSYDGGGYRPIDKDASGRYRSTSTQIRWQSFQAGWNARPGVTVPVEALEYLRQVHKARAALRSTTDPFEYHRITKYIEVTQGCLVGAMIIGIPESALKGGGDAEE